MQTQPESRKKGQTETIPCLHKSGVGWGGRLSNSLRKSHKTAQTTNGHPDGLLGGYLPLLDQFNATFPMREKSPARAPRAGGVTSRVGNTHLEPPMALVASNDFGRGLRKNSKPEAAWGPPCFNFRTASSVPAPGYRGTPA